MYCKMFCVYKKDFHLSKYDWCLWSVQLTPPSEVQVQQTPETVNVTWKSGYEDHLYLGKYLEYNLLLQTPQSDDKVSPFVINSLSFFTFFVVIRSDFWLFQSFPRHFFPILQRGLHAFQDRKWNQVLHIALNWNLNLIVITMMQLGVNGVHRHAGKQKKVNALFSWVQTLHGTDSILNGNVLIWR